MLRTANKLNAREERYATGKEHGETPHLHATVLAGSSSGLVPSDEGPATGCIVDMIEEATLGHQKCIRLERTFWKNGPHLGNFSNWITLEN